ncbi:acyl-CoA dehydrogenase [Balneatrix alpica]|uniref:acyl-CoA dehydrogenase n=1 Tax=Balneatrix alpica TaxID=75684 RepID=UPI0027397BCB|nr:acyl-CoA dehydrogenase [Balneatrix alpica]
MLEYRYPEQEMKFVLEHLVGLERLCQLPGQEEMSPELVEAVLAEAGRLGGDVLAPLNRIGDQQGSSLSADNQVTTAPGFAEAYRAFVEGGWVGLAADPRYGGQGLANVLGTAVMEIWQSANLAFSLNPLLTQGAIEALSHHASEALKQTYLTKLISGEWTGTMNLTEPDAGSDLAAIKAKAVPQGDHYLISGQKIFITWGEHDCAENIVHLVLARLPDAPAGVKGISLFVVPKYLVNQDGSLGARNDLKAVALEHKLGIHGSPTCVMSYGDEQGAVGYLVGQAHQGLACMFTMMNHARQGVGLQGLGVAERAYQQALAYARERMQGYGPDRKTRVPIIKHADVRRMLLTMKSSIEAMRALAYVASAEVDWVKAAADAEQARKHQARVELYTPIVKAWLTELAQEVTYLGVQIHGGMGFIEETGAAQHYRDARILTIYEGTTAIQALDFVGRKLQADGGQALMALYQQMEEDASAWQALPQADVMAFNQALAQAKALSQQLLQQGSSRPQLAAVVSTPLLMLHGYLCGGWLMLKGAAALLAEPSHPLYASKQASAHFYCQHLLPRVQALAAAVNAGEEVVMDLDDQLF